MLKYTVRLLAGYYGVLKLGVRSSSCKSGWLRLLIQCFFGIITVASFIMIVIMSMHRTTDHTITVSRISKCSNFGCTIICTRINSQTEDEYDLVKTVLDLAERCPSMHLDLVEPLFHNQTIPNYWMVNMEAPITGLSIIKGNLLHVEPFAFFSHFFKNVEVFSLIQVTLTEWSSETFLGLQSLNNFKIIESNFNIIERHVLIPHKNTLRMLSIIRCKGWMPENITGTNELPYIDHVDFSDNNFGSLSKASFTQLKNCGYLDLSSSGIITIEAGTFDFMEKITRIDLSDNKLVTLPAGIFDHVIALGNLRFQMHLHSNPWECNCRLEHLLDLNNEGVITIDPICTAPDNKMGRYFSSFHTFCINESSNHVPISEFNNQFPAETIYMSHSCSSNAANHRVIVSPVRRHSCSRQVARVIEQDLNDLSLTFKSYSREVNPLFFIADDDYTMLELKTATEYGLVWYRSSCPFTVFCIETLPQNVKLYNVNNSTTYIMCPITSDGHIKDLSCIKYSARGFVSFELSRLRMLFYLLAILLGIGFGAVSLYGIIRKNPSLLKGSKRVLLVKHKAADALVLPPKISVRFDEVEEKQNKRTFNIISATSEVNSHLVKSFSMRSSKSNAPSYISALQPTDDQLKEWRLKHHFDTGSVYSSISSTEQRSCISCIFDGDMLYSLQVNKTSETCGDI